MRRVNHWIAESARQWQLSKTAATAIFWLPLIGAAAIALARLDKATYRFLLREDGVVEWAQFACFVAACLAAAGVARFRFRDRHPWQALLFAGLAMAMLFAAGEEIAWGQRILGLETPASLSVVNKQNDITLHNIGSTLSVLKLAMMFSSAFGTVAYLANKKLHLQWYWNQANYLLIPPFFLASSFMVVFFYQFVRHAFFPVSGFTVTRYGEWSEFCLAFGVAVFVALNYRRLSTKAKQQLALGLAR